MAVVSCADDFGCDLALVERMDISPTTATPSSPYRPNLSFTAKIEISTSAPEKASSSADKNKQYHINIHT